MQRRRALKNKISYTVLYLLSANTEFNKLSSLWHEHDHRRNLKIRCVRRFAISICFGFAACGAEKKHFCSPFPFCDRDATTQPFRFRVFRFTTFGSLPVPGRCVVPLFQAISLRPSGNYGRQQAVRCAGCQQIRIGRWDQEGKNHLHSTRNTDRTDHCLWWPPYCLCVVVVVALQSFDIIFSWP